MIFQLGLEINFARDSFKWSNLASNKAGVTVVIVGISAHKNNKKLLFSEDNNGNETVRFVDSINAYLSAGGGVFIESSNKPLCQQAGMNYGNMPVDGGNLFVTLDEIPTDAYKHCVPYIRPVAGSHDYINGAQRYCLWIRGCDVEAAKSVDFIRDRIEKTRDMRLRSRDAGSRKLGDKPYQFRDTAESKNYSFIIPAHSSENRDYLPVGMLRSSFIINNSALAIYDAPIWNLSLLASRIHLAWIAAVCGKLETRYRYSKTLGWNTFPVPTLTEKNKADLTRCAENILLAREAHFPKTIADLYDPENMPANLREAHEQNDETLERIYIGRRFKNDTERLEKLFELYTKMTTSPKKAAKA